MISVWFSMEISSSSLPSRTRTPLVENPDAVADFLDLAEEMRAEKNGDAAVLEIENEVADFAGAGGIDAGGGFVEDQEPGLLDQRLGEADALEHPL